jgi:hypothetical protein
MREFAHSVGRFKMWKDEHARRASFLKRLIRVIKKRTRVSICVAVISDDYRAVNAEYPIDEIFGPPYALCGEALLAFVDEWITAEGHEKFPEMVFEDGDTGKGDLIEIFALHGHDAPAFRPKCELNTLQAADLVAWENLKVYTNIFDRQHFELRRSLRELSHVRHIWKVFDMRGLMGIVESMSLPERSNIPVSFLNDIKSERKLAIKAIRSTSRSSR